MDRRGVVTGEARAFVELPTSYLETPRAPSLLAPCGMIIWCAYCQSLIREVEPLTGFDISHGICARCHARLEADPSFAGDDRSIAEFYRALFAAACKADRRACADLVRRAREMGLRPAEVMLGLVQPALVEIGEKWELGEATVADEHEFTAWCEAMLALFEVETGPEEEDLDILIVPAPGNRHYLGPRIAEQALLAAGIRARCIVPELPIDDLVLRIARHRPSWIGFSCALPPMIERSLDVAAKLVERGFSGRFLLSGQALRRRLYAPGDVSIATVCLTIEEARALVQAERSTSPCTSAAHAS